MSSFPRIFKIIPPHFQAALIRHRFRTFCGRRLVLSIDGMAHKIPSTEIDEKDLSKIREAFERGWNVMVWNDHVNLMSYVVFVFQRVLGFEEMKARQHMLEVHHQGKSCVATETREKAELYWQRLQEFGLRTSIERAS